jgi:hypothetical protein
MLPRTCSVAWCSDIMALVIPLTPLSIAVTELAAV